MNTTHLPPFDRIILVVIMMLIASIRAHLVEGSPLPRGPGCWEDRFGNVLLCDGSDVCITCSGERGLRDVKQRWKRTACPGDLALDQEWCGVKKAEPEVSWEALRQSWQLQVEAFRAGSGVTVTSFVIRSPGLEQFFISRSDGECPSTTCNASVKISTPGKPDVLHIGKMITRSTPSTGMLGRDLIPVE